MHFLFQQNNVAFTSRKSTNYNITETARSLRESNLMKSINVLNTKCKHRPNTNTSVLYDTVKCSAHSHKPKKTQNIFQSIRTITQGFFFKKRRIQLPISHRKEFTEKVLNSKLTIQRKHLCKH